VRSIFFSMIVALALNACTQRKFNGEFKSATTPVGTLAIVTVENSQVKQLKRVIGIERDPVTGAESANCTGSNPKFVAGVQGDLATSLKVPVSVVKIGLCSEEAQAGMNDVYLNVQLKAGHTTMIRNDKVVDTVESGTATIKVISTSVRQLMLVIGSENLEKSSCWGGDRKFSVGVPQGQRAPELVVPITVSKIGLCGQAMPVGQDILHLDVNLKKGDVVEIRDDKVYTTNPSSQTATVRVVSTSVRQLIRVIGSETLEAASCYGGNPKYFVDVAPGKPAPDLVVPVSVKKIGLCGQATPTGRDVKQLDVQLKAGEVFEIRD